MLRRSTLKRIYISVVVAGLMACSLIHAAPYSDQEAIEALAWAVVAPDSALVVIKDPFTTAAPKQMRLEERRVMRNEFQLMPFKMVSVLSTTFPLDSERIYIRTKEVGLPSFGWERTPRPSYSPYWSYPEATWLAVIRKPRLAPVDTVPPEKGSDAGRNPFLNPVLKEYLNESNCFELVSLNESAFRVATPVLPSISKELSFNVNEDVPNPNWANAYERALEIWRKDIADHEFLVPEDSLPDVEKIARSLARIRDVPGSPVDVTRLPKLAELQLTTPFGHELWRAILKALGSVE